ncbi:hypothetical protein L596_011009 [Steinernema carpocapsae]|uniref:Gamma-soluble NSF attachment protein n=1 Tax=Steinernema carpocapsae TaxID=34508 RepID=A0A4U5NTF7_STECR|nr:hypothetical protein L596_011009 [Steinernema carpocapsae]
MSFLIFSKYLKTSLIKLKLKPDFDSAAMEYERAAVCYKNANEQGLCKDTYLKAADCHASNRNMFHAAKAKENAAVVARDMGDTLSAILYYEQACDLYAESGTMDTAAMTIDKAAKWMEMADPEKSIAFYKKGLAFVQQTDRSRMAGDFLTRITKLNLKLERYTEAAASVEEEIEKYMEVKEAGRVGQLTTALCLIWLANGDPIAAKRAYGKALKLTGFEHSEDGLACASIISNFESGDDDAFQASLCRPTLRAMDNEYLRLMKKIKIEDEFSNMNISKPVQNENAKFDESQKAPPNEEAVIRCPEPVAVPVVADELVREIHAAPVPTKVESDEDEDDLK